MPVDQVKTKRVAFDENTAATHEVVVAVSGQTIKVKCLHLYAAGANETKIQSGSTVLAAYPMIANQTITLPMIEGQERYFETVDGEALNIDLGAGVRVSGFIVYEQS